MSDLSWVQPALNLLKADVLVVVTSTWHKIVSTRVVTRPYSGETVDELLGWKDFQLDDGLGSRAKDAKEAVENLESLLGHWSFVVEGLESHRKAETVVYSASATGKVDLRMSVAGLKVLVGLQNVLQRCKGVQRLDDCLQTRETEFVEDIAGSVTTVSRQTASPASLAVPPAGAGSDKCRDSNTQLVPSVPYETSLCDLFANLSVAPPDQSDTTSASPYSLSPPSRRSSCASQITLPVSLAGTDSGVSLDFC